MALLQSIHALTVLGRELLASLMNKWDKRLSAFSQINISHLKIPVTSLEHF